MAEIISIQPRSGDLLKRGDAALACGDPQSAVEAFERATRAAPSDPLAWLRLGQARLRLGQLEAADSAFLRAVHHDQHCLPAYEGLAEVYLRQNRPLAYRFALGWVLMIDPQNVGAHRGLALSLEEVGEPWRAKRHWLAILKVRSEGAEADEARRHLLAAKAQVC